MASKGRRLGGDRHTIGFLLDWIDGDYQLAIAEGMLTAARERNANLVCFAGGMFGLRERHSWLRHHAFELASAQSVDVLIVLAGSVGNQAGVETVARYCERFRPLPLISIAAEIAGAPNVVVDNEAGMREVIVHMIEVHESRRIAFIRGPAANEEAERRYGIYRGVLAEHRIELDENLVVTGDFMPGSGSAAVGLLLDDRRLSLAAIDAIVAANDNMALGALKEFERRGIRVPEQIALAGFDDLEVVRYTNPALTTVRQPLFEQGKHVVQLATDMLNGIEVPMRTELKTELVVRRSCRCFSRGNYGGIAKRDGGVRGFEAALVLRRDLILADMTRAAHAALGTLGSGWEARLLNAFIAQLRGDAGDPFLEALDDAIRRIVNRDGNARVLHDVLAALRRQGLASIAPDSAERDRAEDLFQSAVIALGEALERVQAHRRLALQHKARTLGEATSELALCSSEAELGEALGRHLPRLDVGLCFVAVYEDEARTRARLVFAHDAARRLEMPSPRAPFAASELAPAGLFPALSPYAVVVEPLFYGDTPLGYMVLEFGNCDRAVFTTLPALVSAALWRVRSS